MGTCCGVEIWEQPFLNIKDVYCALYDTRDYMLYPRIVDDVYEYSITYFLVPVGKQPQVSLLESVKGRF